MDDRLEADLKYRIQQAHQYEDRALYQAVLKMMQEQVHRIELAQAELDGRSWDHEKW